MGKLPKVYNRESLAIVLRVGGRAHQVVEALGHLVAERIRPKTIRCDNGPELAARYRQAHDS